MEKKKKVGLIGVSALLFAILFYKQEVAINFGILGLLTLGMIHFVLPKNKRDKQYYVLAILVGLMSISQMWYADVYTFFALSFSLLVLGTYIFFSRLNILFYPFLLFANYVLFLYRFLSFEWLPKREGGGKRSWKKIIALVLFPALLAIVFFAVYSTGSSLFYDFIKKIKISENTFYFIGVFLLGFLFYFNFWYPYIPRYLILFNKRFKNEFGENNRDKLMISEDLLDVELQRTSGIITMVLLNLILLFFVISYNYEQFFMLGEARNLSADTHTQINTIIYSIILAMCLILLYFNSYFNFDEKAEKLKKLSYLWLILNSVLVLSAVFKTMQYVGTYGLTTKRIGVFIFLLLCLVGMYYSYVKISQKKTNSFLVTKMAWVFFFTFTLNSMVNYSWIVTKYNLTFVEDVDIDYLYRLDYNIQLLHDYLKTHPEAEREYYGTFEWFANSQESNFKKPFLSQSLYYRYVNLED